ncbi:ribbon-helix-helix domain-containing protein [Cronobacter turicensis]|uniref:ribbon-helix-helix domain-containing protein n=1 Tax=Cronobacter turicensis TaxID=413502 RepID=UPI0011AD1D7A|nr:ribbon-helix-helix domain-containing protein [Cronobacter turicensis]ELU8453269.1 ribbon-helix-helix domain-containing protein [Cronobacter turicensis]EMA1790085.1 ribbon-helix-helix domain-containing protein [Cronobacter turicensis]EMA1800149.1 ribbon-helix-helix domain-containing protein [Cronobacter turicensis]EMA1847362.1 ribbon-helix-helix domain-containing protein [Cronobacter turicensis]EMA1857607.1 ribbon-helix-helix domain-containing protein [Cronobacter turicensis]
MAQSISSIQAKSDDKRGVKPKTYKLKISTIDLISELSEQTGKPQSALIEEAIALLAEKLQNA